MIPTGNSCQGNLRSWLRLWGFSFTSLSHVCDVQQHGIVSARRIHSDEVTLSPDRFVCFNVSLKRRWWVCGEGHRELLPLLTEATGGTFQQGTWKKERLQKVFFFVLFKPRTRDIEALRDAHQRFGRLAQIANEVCQTFFSKQNSLFQAFSAHFAGSCISRK